MAYRHFLIIIFLFVVSFYGSAQENKQQSEDSIAFIQLAKKRQQFWDHLPSATGFTNDWEHVFTTAQSVYLDSLISAFEKESTAQICVVSIDSSFVSKDNFDALALHILRAWGVGQKETNNGIVILFSVSAKKIRISNGYGIENILSDEETKVVLDNYILSSFKQGDYFGGIVNGVKALMDIIRKRADWK